MKKIFLILVSAMAYSQFVHAEWDKDYTDRRLRDERSKTETRISNLSRDVCKKIESNAESISALNKRIEELQKSINDLQEKVDDYWSKGATNLTGTDTKANVALWIISLTALALCAVLCLIFWPRKPVSNAMNTTLSTKHKCPRCGWEHDPGDTICKNPNCKTQF